jgi:RNA polymerase sigma factor (sigma-70 family)
MSPPRDLFEVVWRDHEKLVLGLAHRLHPKNPTTMRDLMATGMVGLWQAWQKYDPSASNDGGLWGFANFRVLGAMRDHLRELDLMNRSERSTAKQQGLEIPERFEVSLDHAVSLPSEQPAAPILLAQEELRSVLLENLLELDHPLGELLFERYFDEKKLAEIGLERGYSESRACQIEKKALAQLKLILEHEPRMADDIRERLR